MIAEQMYQIESLKKQLDEIEVKYSEVSREDEQIIQINILRKRESNESYALELNITIEKKPDHLFFYIQDVYEVENIDILTKILREVSILNLDRVIYGNMGYDPSDNTITYTNAVSLSGQNSISNDQLLDYIFYASFICDKVNEHLTTFEKSLEYGE